MRACLTPTLWKRGLENSWGWFSEMPTVNAAEAVAGSASASAQATRSVMRNAYGPPR